MRGRGGRCRWLCASGTAILALAALAAALAWHSIFDAVLAAQLALIPGSMSYERWLSPTVPLRFNVHLFNWTNPEEFPDVVPNFEQLGPYIFVEHRSHVNVTWHQHNSSLAYRTLRTWHFDPEASNGSLDDVVTSLNAIAASAVYRYRNWGYLQQKTLSVGLTVYGEQFSITRTAGELMFDGYSNVLLDIAKNMPDSETGGAPKVDKFGWFYGRNNSIDTDGYVEVTSGSARSTLPGQILKWNHQEELPYYNGECAKLRGSVGEFLPRDLTEQSSLTMFIADLCRTVHMDYTGSGQVGSLNYHTYAINENSFDNATSSSKHTCFCNGDCAWGGVMNVSACRYGSPAFITLPHFLHADPELRNLVTGMEPDPDKHTFFFSVEPKLGIPLDVAARFQVNMFVESNPNINLYQNVPRMLFPILWVEQRVTVGEDVLTELRFVRNILDWGAIFCAGIALLFASVVALTTCTNICASKKKFAQKDMFEKPIDEAELKLNPSSIRDS